MIYHYTTIETLALILESRKLRFNRLDRVDDLQEAQSVQGINFGKFFFVSCWTQTEEESIPQWHMYTDKMQGVRIGLPDYPFCSKRLEAPSGWIETSSSGEILSPISMEEMMTDTYLIVPACLDQKHFGGSVQYVNNVQERYAASVELTQREDSAYDFALRSPATLVRTKSPDWGFQKEFRFFLLALPSLPVPPEGPGSPKFYDQLPTHMLNSMLSGAGPGVEWIDLDVAEEAFEQMTITTGPCCSQGQKLCVEALKNQLASNATLKPSVLEGRIRAR